MSEEKRKAGRPVGTAESIESLAKRNAQRDLKLLQEATQIAEKEQRRIETALAAQTPGMEEYEKLFRLLLLVRESLIKNIALGAKIASSDPSRANEEDSSASAKEFLKQMEGEEV